MEVTTEERRVEVLLVDQAREGPNGADSRDTLQSFQLRFDTLLQFGCNALKSVFCFKSRINRGRFDIKRFVLIA